MTRVASMSMTTQPARVFPAISSHGNPAGVASISFHACARALARARAIRSSADGVPARSSARRTVGPLGAAPSTGARWASSAMSLMLVAPSAIAAAIETSTIPRSSSGDVPFFRSAAAQGGGEPGLVGGLAEQDRAGVADQALPVRGDLQGMVPPVMLHGEERSSSGDSGGGNP